jgi:hypothetical protein
MACKILDRVAISDTILQRQWVDAHFDTVLYVDNVLHIYPFLSDKTCNMSSYGDSVRTAI